MKLHRNEIDSLIKVNAFVISAQWYFYILYCHSTSADDMSTLPHLLGDLVNEGRSKGRPKSGHAQRGLHVTLSIVPNENGLQAGPLARVTGRTRCGVKTSAKRRKQTTSDSSSTQNPTESQLFGHVRTTNDRNCQIHVTCPYKLQPLLFACPSTIQLCCFCPVSASQRNNISITRPTLA